MHINVVKYEAVKMLLEASTQVWRLANVRLAVLQVQLICGVHQFVHFRGCAAGGPSGKRAASGAPAASYGTPTSSRASTASATAVAAPSIDEHE
jgi:hypothetical protein